MVRQFVTESLVLVAASSLVGLIATYELIRILLGLVSEDAMSHLPFLQGLSLNIRVLGFAMCLAGLAAVLFSLAPMARMRLSKLHEALADSGRSVSGRAWRRLGSNLVVVELAVAMVLLVGAGLAQQKFVSLVAFGSGIRARWSGHAEGHRAGCALWKISRNELLSEESWSAKFRLCRECVRLRLRVNCR